MCFTVFQPGQDRAKDGGPFPSQTYKARRLLRLGGVCIEQPRESSSLPCSLLPRASHIRKTVSQSEAGGGWSLCMQPVRTAEQRNIGTGSVELNCGPWISHGKDTL